MRRLVPLSLFFACACFLDAQTPGPLPPVPTDPLSLGSRQLEFFNLATQKEKADEASQATAARNEELARYQFLTKANQFVALWEAFAEHLNGTQTFDAKLARKLSKAFHELETSDGWPIRDQSVKNNRGK